MQVKKNSLIPVIVIVIAISLIMAYLYFNQPTEEDRWLEITRQAEKLDEKIDKYVDKMAGGIDCSILTAEVNPASETLVNVFGTLTNECEYKIRYAEIAVACFDASGLLVDTDTEYLRNIKPGKQAQFESPMIGEPQQISDCTLKIIVAEY